MIKFKFFSKFNIKNNLCLKSKNLIKYFTTNIDNKNENMEEVNKSII